MRKGAAKFLVRTITTSVLDKQTLSNYLKRAFMVLVSVISISLSTKPLLAQSIVKDWDRAYEPSSLNRHALTDAIRTSDGRYLLAGHYRNCNIIGVVPSDHDSYWVVKISRSGTLQWQRSFSGSSTDQQTSVIQTSDGSYLLGGSSKSSISGDKTQGIQGSYDYWIVKISSTGAKVWDKRFGGGSIDHLASIVQASDDGYLLAGYSLFLMGGDKLQNGFGQDFWIVKINSTGVKQWDKVFGGSSAEFLTSAIRTSGVFLFGLFYC